MIEINKKENITIFLTSHDVGDIESLCDRTIVINHGTIINDLPTKELSKTFAFEKHIDLIPKTTFKNFPTLPVGATYFLQNEDKITVTVDINKLSVQDSLKKLLELFEVEDVDVYNTELETTIRHIYESR